MSSLTAAAMKDVLNMFLQPWLQALEDPAGTQEKVLHQLLGGYGRTEYGRECGAVEVRTLADYRAAFPATTYDGYWSRIEQAMTMGRGTLLYEDPVAWAITRGTTKGESKFIPMTPTDIRMRSSAGRAIMNYVQRTANYEVLQGVNLNLNFPSVVGTIDVGAKELDYGYSSGIYLKHTTSSLIRSVPAQAEIDGLGGGKTVADWERRFELAYEKGREEDVTFVGGVAPTAVAFGRYLYQAHRVYPKELWDIKVMTLGSVPGINTKYAPRLRAMYGPVEVVEIYGATEGMFGQQMDEKRAWVPNYDLFLFEVETRRGVKMLHQMEPGETGRLLVSTPIFPRYQIGDLIRAFEPPYFRCIGRDRLSTHLRYWWDALVMWEFDRL